MIHSYKNNTSLHVSLNIWAVQQITRIHIPQFPVDVSGNHQHASYKQSCHRHLCYFVTLLILWNALWLHSTAAIMSSIGYFLFVLNICFVQ